MVLIAGNVSITAARLRMPACKRGPSPGSAATASDNGRPSARNSGTTSSSRIVCTDRT